MFLFGIKFSKDEKFLNCLMRIYGINRSLAGLVCGKLGISSKTPLSLVEPKHIKFANYYLLGRYPIQDSLKKKEIASFKQEMRLKTVKAFRFKKGLPVRGQRTKTNAKTAKRLNLFKFNLGF